MATVTTSVRRLSLAGAVAGVLVLGGCVVAPVGPYYGEPVPVAPPPPQVEYYGAPPVAGYVWLGGYWNWTGGRYAWTPGHWSPPRHGHRWSPHRWEHGPRGWQQRPGQWQRR